MISQILGWIGNGLFFIGAIWLARKNVLGFWSQLIANLLYVVQSQILGNSSLLWLSIGLGIFNIYGIYKWSKKC